MTENVSSFSIGTHIERIGFSEEILWLLTSTGTFKPCGTLTALDINEGKIMAHGPPSQVPIEDFCILPDHDVLAVTNTHEIWKYAGSDWEILAHIPIRNLQERLAEWGLNSSIILEDLFDRGIVQGEGFFHPPSRIIRILPWQDNLLIVTPCGIIRYTISSGTFSSRDFPFWIRFGYRSPAAITSDGVLYLGSNSGEFGGDLKAIDLQTGSVTFVPPPHVPYNETDEEREKKNGIACQITGIIRDSTNPRHIIYSAGVQHFYFHEHGGLFRCQGTKSEAICEKAVFDLVSCGSRFYAATSTAILEFKGDERTVNECTVHSYGDRYQIADLRVSTPIRGLIVVGTTIMQSVSISTMKPLLAIEYK